MGSPRPTSTPTEASENPPGSPRQEGRSFGGEVSSRASGGRRWGRAESRPAAPQAPLASLLAGTAPRTSKHPAAGAGWLAPAGVSLGWTVSSLPSAWAVARTPRCTRPTPRWVWAGCARGVPAPGIRLVCVSANPQQARLGDRKEQETGDRFENSWPAAAWPQAGGGGWS